jgi:hypothetical protein
MQEFDCPESTPVKSILRRHALHLLRSSLDAPASRVLLLVTAASEPFWCGGVL